MFTQQKRSEHSSFAVGMRGLREQVKIDLQDGEPPVEVDISFNNLLPLSAMCWRCFLRFVHLIFKYSSRFGSDLPAPSLLGTRSLRYKVGLFLASCSRFRSVLSSFHFSAGESSVVKGTRGTCRGATNAVQRMKMFKRRTAKLAEPS